MMTAKQWVVVGVIAVSGFFAYGMTTNSTENSPQQPSGADEKLSWKLYRAENGRFEVLFPALPQHVAENRPSGSDYTKYDVYLAQEQDGTVYLISMTQYPPSFDAGDADDFLEGIMMNAVQANQKNKLLHSIKTKFLNFPALDFEIQNGDYSTKGRAIWCDKTLFVETVMARTASRAAHDFETFANSLVIHPQQPPATVNK